MNVSTTSARLHLSQFLWPLIVRQTPRARNGFMVYLAGLEGLSGRQAANHVRARPRLDPAVTPNSAKSDLPARARRGTRRADLATRLKGRLRALRTQLDRRDTLIEAVREANATKEPKRSPDGSSTR